MSDISARQIDEDVRPVDPNVLQRQASNPDVSAWVAASAGAGKTTVLTSRILRLLLPRANGTAGTPPQKILALTFTKTAASEMALKINTKLASWAVAREEDYIKELRDLLGREPSAAQIEEGRKLFAKVVDTPGGLKIMTIHSFCQSILGRFPLEAGLTPHFKALEEFQARELVLQAQNQIINKARQEKGSPLAEAFFTLAGEITEDQFSDLLSSMVGERRQTKLILERQFGADGLYTALCQELDVRPGQSEDDILREICADGAFDEVGLRRICGALAQGSESSDQPMGLGIQYWLDALIDERIKRFEAYKDIFLKSSDGQIRARLGTKKVQDIAPDCADILRTEAQRLLDAEEKRKAAKCAALTRDCFLIGHEILQQYEVLKKQQAALDFDDLILTTLDLLSGKTLNKTMQETAPWVRYKLDQGIDHILVDEAQDTNPEQWEIIRALCDDFFSGEGAGESDRSIFVVGDEKQSIFSFQRASPQKFNDMNAWFDERVSQSGKKLETVPINISFRSVKSVLELVDQVFKPDSMQTGLGNQIDTHQAFRRNQPGLTELWPVFETTKEKKEDWWAPPLEIRESSSGAARMAKHIGQTIAGWVEQGSQDILESQQRPINPGDIMILVRSRTRFIGQIVKELKARNIPVSGVDRMVLTEELAVQDLLAAAGFALQPGDDLTLACLLKSPLIGMSEEDLYNLAQPRGNRPLWQALKESDETDIADYLGKLIKASGEAHPYEFFAQILQTPCPADPVSGLRAIKARLGEEALDPLDEFLNEALNYENDHIPTLQGFVHYQMHHQTEIKRQMEEGGNAVRIMTVHASKGLQSPIVILPDTMRTSGSRKAERLLWPDRSEGNLPVFCPRSADAPSLFQTYHERIQAKLDEEYKRLLYVAMTRAEDRLYIGGYTGQRKPIEDSWYYYIERAFQTLSGVEEIHQDGFEAPLLRYSNSGTSYAKQPEVQKSLRSQDSMDKPGWLFKPAPEEPDPPRPLIPSRPSEPEPAVSSPLMKDQNYRFKRGQFIHILLQFLPDLTEDKREDAARTYLAKPGHGLSAELQESILKEVLSIIRNPEFSRIFGPGSMAEVPVTGLIDGKTMISGQIDRLLITDNEILIVDYKSNRPPPQNEADVPDIYRKQMKAYKDALLQIYPDRAVKCALIWTEEARVMEVSL